MQSESEPIEFAHGLDKGCKKKEASGVTTKALMRATRRKELSLTKMRRLSGEQVWEASSGAQLWTY